MTDESLAPDLSLMARGTPQSLALGVDVGEGWGGGLMRAPFRADLVGDPALGGLADGVIYTLLDQACGAAIGVAVKARAEMQGRELAFVRGAAFETDPDDPIALVQAAFMLSTPSAGA